MYRQIWNYKSGIKMAVNACLTFMRMQGTDRIRVCGPVQVCLASVMYPCPYPESRGDVRLRGNPNVDHVAHKAFNFCPNIGDPSWKSWPRSMFKYSI